MLKRLIASLVCFTFIFSNLQQSQAQDFSIDQLPVPGTMVGVSTPFAPLALKGLIVNPQKPLEFQFIVDTGRGPQDTASVKDQANQLVKYFLAGLTIPEGELWVNLSPYEKDRMVPEALGQTDLGRDLLAQDYFLKQLTASLIYPERDLGKEFWSRVYAKAQQQFGTTDIPVNTFNKVWILPDQAQVFENGNAAYVTRSTLKVMLDEDYLALQKHVSLRGAGGDAAISEGTTNDTHSLASNIVRQIVLPEIEKEVNTGKNFAPLRQIYQALILAKWYKETIQNGLLDAIYTDKNKTAGVNVSDPAIKEKIYQRYLQAYKKGAFNYIKDTETPNGVSGPRKYFSGGLLLMPKVLREDGNRAMISLKSWTAGALLLVAVGCYKSDGAKAPGEKAMSTEITDQAMLREPDETDGFIAKRARDDERIKRQVIQIETALGHKDTALDKVAEVMAYLNEPLAEGEPSHFKKEEAAILSDTTEKGSVIGRIDRKIAEKFGYAHETANIVVLTPDGKRVVTQLRNKTNYDDHLSMYGGHLTVGESSEHSAVDELKQELGFADEDNLDSKPVFVDSESYDLQGDPNKERRYWFIYKLSPREWKLMEDKRAIAEKVLGISESTPWPEYKAVLFDAQNGIIKPENFSNVGLGTGVVDILIRSGYLKASAPSADGKPAYKLGDKKAEPEVLRASFVEREAQLIGEVLGVFQNGSGEVIGNYFYTFDELANAKTAAYTHKGTDPARFDGQQIRVLKLEGESSPGAPSVVPLTPDSLDHLLSSGDLWKKIKTKAEDLDPSMFSWFSRKSNEDDMQLTDRSWKKSILLLKLLDKAGNGPDQIGMLRDQSFNWMRSKNTEKRIIGINTLRYLFKLQHIPYSRALLDEVLNIFFADNSLPVKLTALGFLGAMNTKPNPLDHIPAGKAEKVIEFRQQVTKQILDGQHDYTSNGVNADIARESSGRSGQEAFRNVIAQVDVLDAAQKSKLPEAVKSLKDLGGIDLNQINVKRTGKIINVRFDPAQLNALMQGGFEGFTPVITNITRIQSPFQLSGIGPSKGFNRSPGRL